MAPEVVQALLTEQPVIQEIVVTVHFQDLVADHTGPTGPGHHFFEMLMERKYVITHKDIVKSGVSCEYTFVYLPSMYPDGYVMPPPQKEQEPPPVQAPPMAPAHDNGTAQAPQPTPI